MAVLIVGAIVQPVVQLIAYMLLAAVILVADHAPRRRIASGVAPHRRALPPRAAAAQASTTQLPSKASRFSTSGAWPLLAN